MWNTNSPFEFNPGINNAKPSDGMSPPHFDLARQEYLESRQAQVEMDRRLVDLAGWSTLSPWCLLTGIGS